MSDPNPYAAPGWVEANGASDQLPAPQYILTARTPHGRLVTERVEAVSGDAAVEMFRDQGFTDIVLHTDDVAALLQFPKGAQKFVSPRDFVEGRTRHGYSSLREPTTGLRRTLLGADGRQCLTGYPNSAPTCRRTFMLSIKPKHWQGWGGWTRRSS
jgi:hypothetical protein